MMMATDIQPRIYVACLAAYNDGKLYGKWIDADQSAEDIQAEVAEMLKGSPEPGAEEWAIHDSEGFGWSLSEWESFERVAEWGQAIAEHGEPFQAFVALFGDDATVEAFDDAFVGVWDSELDCAYDLADDLCLFDGTPEDSIVRNYFDYAAFARDLFIGDYVSRDVPGGVAVFRRDW